MIPLIVLLAVLTGWTCHVRDEAHRLRAELRDAHALIARQAEAIAGHDGDLCAQHRDFWAHLDGVTRSVLYSPLRGR